MLDEPPQTSHYRKLSHVPERVLLPQIPTTTLILGGARSGKSGHAQRLAEAACTRQVYIATAEALDDEMSDRIARHRADRGESWTTVECPLELCRSIENACNGQNAVVVDCLTLWLSNVMHANRDVAEETERLLRTLNSVATPLILISNEVGMGIVPQSSLGRRFRDEQGRLNQRVAKACVRVEFIASGLPLRLKG